MKTETLFLSKELYSKEALLKAAYSFVDKYYIHLESNSESFRVEMISKEGKDIPKDISKQFENEILAQTVRECIYKKTHDLREIIYARAVASTMVIEDDPIKEVQEDENDTAKLESILKDWFKND